MRMNALRACLAVQFVVILAHAAESPYSGLETREIKAMSAEQIAGYLAGDGMGLALPAELNGYPGPRHVLDLASELELSPAQRTAVRGVFDDMRGKAIAIGKQIVAAEASLNAAFADKTVTPGRLDERVEALGLLQGKLRAVHLLAHLQTEQILSPTQVDRYVALRGYRHEGHTAPDHAGHHHGH